MKSGWMVRARRTTAVGVVGVFAVASMGCTGGGGDDALVVDDDDAGATLAAAVEDARADSGRLHLETTESSSNISAETVVDYEFAGDDARATMTLTSTVGDDEGFGPLTLSVLEVGGATYVSDDVVTMFYEDEAELPSELDGIEWVDVSDERSDTASGDGLLLSGLVSVSGDPFTLFDELSDVTADGTEELDGQTYERFHASLSVDAYERLVNGSSDEDAETSNGDVPDETSPDDPVDESDRRWQAIDDYTAARTTVEGVFLVDAEGRLRRAVVEYSVDIEDQFADCGYLTGSDENQQRLVVDVADLGADIVIDAPDPSVVISSARADELVDSMLGADDPSGPMLTTADGEWTREALVQLLREEGEIIGVDPATVEALSDEQLVARADELTAALAALPTFDTPFGPMQRTEMLRYVRIGMEMEGVDPALADSMTDEQLAALITGYLESKAQEAASSDEAEDEFAGCPG